MRNKRVLVWGLTMGLVLCSNPANAIAISKNNLSNKPLVLNSAPKGVFLVSKAKTKSVLKKYANARSLTDRELVELLKAVGFKGKGLRTAWAVAKSESNGRPLAYNGNRKTGDSSYGVFQVNMIGKLGPDRREKFNLKSNTELFNPVKNAQIVFHMTQGGTNWKSWKNAKTLAVTKWLSLFPGEKI